MRLTDQELRSTIQAATTKSEQLNHFLKRVFFGGEGVITENSRDEQRKVPQRLLTDASDWPREDVPGAALACVSPYLTEHINRFGHYSPNMNRKPPNPAYEFSLRVQFAATG